MAQCHGLEVLHVLYHVVPFERIEVGFVRHALAPSLPRLRRVFLLGELSVDDGAAAAETVVGMCLMQRAERGLPPLELTSCWLLTASSAEAVTRELAAAGQPGHRVGRSPAWRTR